MAGKGAWWHGGEKNERGDFYALNPLRQSRLIKVPRGIFKLLFFLATIEWKIPQRNGKDGSR